MASTSSSTSSSTASSLAPISAGTSASTSSSSAPSTSSSSSVARPPLLSSISQTGGETALWLHNKLGTTNDLWSDNSSIISQLNADVIRQIKKVFIDLQVNVKLKLLLSFLHISRRNLDEWKDELEQVLEVAALDADPWVSVVGEMLRHFPRQGTLNFDFQSNNSTFFDLVNDIKKIVKKHGDRGILPLESLYLNRRAFENLFGQPAAPEKQFNLKRKAKSASLRSELLQKALDAQSGKRPIAGPAVPIRCRGLNSDTTPLKGIPSRNSFGGYSGSSSKLGFNRLTSFTGSGDRCGGVGSLNRFSRFASIGSSTSIGSSGIGGSGTSAANTSTGSSGGVLGGSKRDGGIVLLDVAPVMDPASKRRKTIPASGAGGEDSGTPGASTGTGSHGSKKKNNPTTLSTTSSSTNVVPQSSDSGAGPADIVDKQTSTITTTTTSSSNNQLSTTLPSSSSTSTSSSASTLSSNVIFGHKSSTERANEANTTTTTSATSTMISKPISAAAAAAAAAAASALSNSPRGGSVNAKRQSLLSATYQGSSIADRTPLVNDPYEMKEPSGLINTQPQPVPPVPASLSTPAPAAPAAPSSLSSTSSSSSSIFASKTSLPSGPAGGKIATPDYNLLRSASSQSTAASSAAINNSAANINLNSRFSVLHEHLTSPLSSAVTGGNSLINQQQQSQQSQQQSQQHLQQQQQPTQTLVTRQHTIFQQTPLTLPPQHLQRSQLQQTQQSQQSSSIGGGSSLLFASPHKDIAGSAANGSTAAAAAAAANNLQSPLFNRLQAATDPLSSLPKFTPSIAQQQQTNALIEQKKAMLAQLQQQQAAFALVSQQQQQQQTQQQTQQTTAQKVAPHQPQIIVPIAQPQQPQQYGSNNLPQQQQQQPLFASPSNIIQQQQAAAAAAAVAANQASVIQRPPTIIAPPQPQQPQQQPQTHPPPAQQSGGQMPYGMPPQQISATAAAPTRFNQLHHAQQPPPQAQLSQQQQSQQNNNNQSSMFAASGAPPLQQPAQQQPPPPPQPAAQHTPQQRLMMSREHTQIVQQIFQQSNCLTRPEKALILGFMGGTQANPAPSAGPVSMIKYREFIEEHRTTTGAIVRVLVEEHFQMNFDSGEWKTVRSIRQADPNHRIGGLDQGNQTRIVVMDPIAQHQFMTTAQGRATSHVMMAPNAAPTVGGGARPGPGSVAPPAPPPPPGFMRV